VGVLVIVGIEDERNPDVGHPPERLESRRGDPDDPAPLFELDALAKDIGEAAKALLPHAVTNDDDRLRARRSIAPSKASSEDRLLAKHVEVLVRDKKGRHDPRISAARQREPRRGVGRKRLERARAVAKRLETFAREVMLGPDANEPIPGVISERPQDDVMDDAPNSDVGAHPERERHDRHRCKARGPAEASEHIDDVRAKRVRLEPRLPPKNTCAPNENRDLLPVPESRRKHPSLPQPMREELSKVLCYLTAFRRR
jgi:hypothetical protein